MLFRSLNVVAKAGDIAVTSAAVVKATGDSINLTASGNISSQARLEATNLNLVAGGTINTLTRTDTVTAKLFAEGEYRPSGTKKYLTLTDHLGSVRDVVDITGTPTLVAAFDYTPYGAIARSYGSISPVYQWAGLVADISAGVLLSATRAYNPANGKWFSVDPIREAGGINLTGYVGSSPINFVDVLGLARTWMNLGQGYTGGLDVFNGPGGRSEEHTSELQSH